MPDAMPDLAQKQTLDVISRSSRAGIVSVLDLSVEAKF
jgi:hypothetical protein